MLSKARKKVYELLESRVGNTPICEIKKIAIQNGNRIFAKEEWKNPTGSIFDRVYPYLFKIAEEEGKIIPGVTPVVEASTGNAGASFAWCAKKLGYDDCIVIIHKDAPKVRIDQIKSFGAKILYSPAGQYTKGYVALLEKVLKEDKEKKGGKIGENPERLYCVTKINPKAREVYHQFVNEALKVIPKIDYFVGAVGSGTSISGIGKYLKIFCSSTKIIAVDPSESPSTYCLKYEKKSIDFNKMPHNVWGGATFGVPLKKLNLDLKMINNVQLVNKAERDIANEILSKVENKKVGRTSCCVFAVAYRMSEILKKKNILICLYDPRWKYGNDNSVIK